MRKLFILLLIGLTIALSCKKDDDGSSNTNTPASNTPPTASFSVTPNTGDTQTNFQFDASGSSDNEDANSALQVRWDFENDGTWDATWTSNKTINHQYGQEGTYNATVEVKDSEGLTNSITKSVVVTNGGSGGTPVANFSGYPTSGSAPLSVNFTDQSTNNPTSWSWDFGDGGTSTQENPSHTYTTQGSYTVSLTVSNSYGNDTEIKSNYINVSSGGGNTFTDSRDGQTYNIVTIGSQIWMAENLNYQTGNSWCYDDNPSNCDTYGRLYDWQTALGACPNGWHLPSDNEWCTLTTYIDPTVDCNANGWSGTDAGYKMKNTSGWYSNGNGSDAYGFAALPGGRRGTIGGFDYVEKSAYFWSSTGNGADAWSRHLTYGGGEVYRYGYNQENGFSVRCLKD